MRVVRSRGALSGFLLLLLGIWGALIPFVGPYFNYAYTPNSAWTWTAGRLWLEVLPGIATAVAGVLIMTTANRSVGIFAGWLASLSGAWFILGPILGRLWNGAEGAAGTPVGGTARQVWEQIGFFAGLGTAILFLGALALGRFTVTSLRDLRAADKLRPVEREREREPVEASAAPVAAAGPATTFRENRVEQERVVAEPVGARAGASEAGTHAAGTHAADVRATDTRAIDTRSTDTRAAETRSVDTPRPVDEGTRPVETVGSNAVRNDTVRNDTVRNDTVRNDTVRNDALGNDAVPGRGASSEGVRGENVTGEDVGGGGTRSGGLMGRMRERMQGDRTAGGAGATRNDALDDQQRS